MRHRSVFAGSFYNVLGQINDDKNSGEFIEVPLCTNSVHHGCSVPILRNRPTAALPCDGRGSLAGEHSEFLKVFSLFRGLWKCGMLDSILEQ